MSVIVVITPPPKKDPQPHSQVVHTDAGASIVDDCGQVKATFTSYDAAISYLKSLQGI